jgi:hypothetical protein
VTEAKGKSERKRKCSFIAISDGKALPTDIMPSACSIRFPDESIVNRLMVKAMAARYMKIT